MRDEPARQIADFLAGGGEAGAVIRGFDWSSHPLGLPDTWPQPLRTSVSLMLATGHPICLTWGADLTLLYNDAYAPILAARHPQAMAQPIAEVWADVWPDISPLVDRALAGESVWFEDMYLQMERNGRLSDTWWTFSYSPIRDEDGIARGFINICNDSTGKVENERRLEVIVAERTAELRQFQAIVEATTSPICAFDTDYRLIAFNTAHNDEFRRVNGFDTKLGDVFPDLFIEEQRPVMRALMTRALTGDRFTVTEEFGRPELGQPLWEISYTPLHDASGAIIGAFHLATDISDRIRAEADLALAQEALRQSQKMEAMGSLTGGVAHDFNNLLTPIVGSLDLLQRKGLGGEREQRLIEGALQSAERAKTLVQSLLAFARRQPLQAEAVDMVALVEGMAGLVASTSGPRVRFEINIAPDLPPAVADANQIEMALLNLAVNARDAMPEGGQLTIAAASEIVDGPHRVQLAPGRYVRLCVADTGIGMDPDTLERAIEPFFSTKGIGKGTGLGLSMVHGVAAQLGGGLAIESAPGAGTRVELWLPASENAVAAEEQSASEAGRTSAASGTVLLVDDEELVRESTADMLGDLGFEVVEAASAEMALELLEQGVEPVLVITDHLMPGMSGTELAWRVRNDRPNVPVLIMSGYADVEGIAPDLPRLLKPFRSADLAGIVSDLVAPA